MKQFYLKGNYTRIDIFFIIVDRSPSGQVAILQFNGIVVSLGQNIPPFGTYTSRQAEHEVSRTGSKNSVTGSLRIIVSGATAISTHFIACNQLGEQKTQAYSRTQVAGCKLSAGLGHQSFCFAERICTVCHLKVKINSNMMVHNRIIEVDLKSRENCRDSKGKIRNL